MSLLDFSQKIQELNSKQLEELEDKEIQEKQKL